MIYSDFKTKIQDGHAPCQFIDRRQHFCYVMICFQDSPIWPFRSLSCYPRLRTKRNQEPAIYRVSIQYRTVDQVFFFDCRSSSYQMWHVVHGSFSK